MTEKPQFSTSRFGSKALDEIVLKLNQASEPKRRYEYVLWLAKKLPEVPPTFKDKAISVKGCVSQVFINVEYVEGRLFWSGESDALITRGLLALLINGLSNLTPLEVLNVDPHFIEATGLQVSLTPSRANGFMNILLTMKNLAKDYLGVDGSDSISH